MSDTSTEAVERMAQHYDAANESLPDPRRNLTSTTLRALAAERDALRTENERQRAEKAEAEQYRLRDAALEKAIRRAVRLALERIGISRLKSEEFFNGRNDG